jgi:hypothetical protein
MKAMSSLDQVYRPNPTAVARHNARFAIYEDLQATARSASSI